MVRKKSPTKSDNVLYIVMPAYNEADNIEQVVKDWYPVVEKHDGGGKSRLVVVNDGSKDDTYKVLTDLAETRPLLKPINKKNQGHGATVLYAYHYALKNGADYIFQTDSDGQTLPSEFEPFWKERDNKAAIIGYRSHREDGFSRVVVTKTLKLVLRLVFGINVTDANTPYRLMKRETLEKYIGQIPKDFNLSNVMLTVLLIRNKEDVEFKTITFRPRQGGVNSINIPKITKIGWQAVKDFRKIKIELNKTERANGKTSTGQ